MKRYLTFSYSQFYPRGGWNDFRGSFDTLEESIEHLLGYNSDFREVIDSETGEEVQIDWDQCPKSND